MKKRKRSLTSSPCKPSQIITSDNISKSNHDIKESKFQSKSSSETNDIEIISSIDGTKIYPPFTPAKLTGRSDGFSQSCPLREPPKDRPIRIYADGVFDLFHIGHMNQLQQAKQAFPNTYLLVGVCSDKETHKRKGKTVLTDIERYQTVSHCKWVDEVIQDAPWIIDEIFLKKHNIDYVAHDALPYLSNESGDIYQPIKESGKFLETRRTQGVSTTDLIVRIVRDYDDYLLRNLSRGVKRQDLNVSFIKEQELHAKKGLQELRRILLKNLHRTGEDILSDLRLIEGRSQEFARGFTTFFSSSPRNRSPSFNEQEENGNTSTIISENQSENQSSILSLKEDDFNNLDHREGSSTPNSPPIQRERERENENDLNEISPPLVSSSRSSRLNEFIHKWFFKRGRNHNNRIFNSSSSSNPSSPIDDQDDNLIPSKRRKFTK